MRVGGVPFHFIANLKDRGVLRFVRKIDLHHCFMDVESPDGYFCIRYHFLEGKFFITVQRHEDGHLVAISSYFSKQLARSTLFMDCDAAAGVMIALYLLCCLESWNRSMGFLVAYALRAKEPGLTASRRIGKNVRMRLALPEKKRNFCR
jgi:hypothetical protein